MVLLVLSPGDRPCARHGLSPRSIRFSRYAPPVASARRAARRYIAIPGAPRGRLSSPPRFLHIRGGEGPGSPAAAGRARAPTRSDRRTARGIAGAPGGRRGGARKAKKKRGPGGPRSAPIWKCRPLQLGFNYYTRSLYSNARDVYKQHKSVK